MFFSHKALFICMDVLIPTAICLIVLAIGLQYLGKED